MSNETSTPNKGFWQSHFEKVDDHWEWWARLGVALFCLQLVAWAVALLRLGIVSVYAHAMIVPFIGMFTMPIMLWGLVRSLLNPPVLRKSRTIGFSLALLAGFSGNVHMMSVPLSTENWESTHEYRLPFDGVWYTLAGGDSRATNYHATTATYRWGYDFTILEEGKKYRSDGKTADDYFCFGEPVLAPVSGKVVEMVDYEVDNVPGEVPPRLTLGNYIILEVSQDEYLFLAHLRNDSITVRVGQSVETGQELAQCGNSGRSIEPHLHVHLQKTRDFPFSESLPLRFSGYRANGSLVENGMPVGETAFEKLDGQYVEQR